MRLNPRLTHSSLMLVDKEEGEEELEEGEEEEVQLLLSVVAFQCKYNSVLFNTCRGEPN